MTIYELLKSLEDILQDPDNDYTLDTPVVISHFPFLLEVNGVKGFDKDFIQITLKDN